MGSKENNESNPDVRQRILDAAESLFAEKGYDKTSVRDITKMADCNVASVNYYFSGKENLHVEVYRQHLTILRDMRVNAMNEAMAEKNQEITLEELIQVFVEAFFKPFSDNEKGHQRMMLMWREMIEPHLPENIFFDEVISPVAKVFIAAVNKICPELDNQQVLFSLQSIVGQMAHIIMSIHIFPTCKNEFSDNFDLDAFIEHVVTFSTAGIKELAKKGAANVVN